jgi:hypothetical protein
MLARTSAQDVCSEDLYVSVVLAASTRRDAPWLTQRGASPSGVPARPPQHLSRSQPRQQQPSSRTRCRAQPRALPPAPPAAGGGVTNTARRQQGNKRTCLTLALRSSSLCARPLQRSRRRLELAKRTRQLPPASLVLDQLHSRFSFRRRRGASRRKRLDEGSVLNKLRLSQAVRLQCSVIQAAALQSCAFSLNRQAMRHGAAARRSSPGACKALHTAPLLPLHGCCTAAAKAPPTR